MKIGIFGYGLYTLGDKQVENGIILPSILTWISKRRIDNCSICIFTKNLESETIASKKLKAFLVKYDVTDRINFEFSRIDNYNSYLDIVIIATPESQHLKLVKSVVGKTSTIICVKPVTRNQIEFNEISNICKNNNIKFFIDFHKNFDESCCNIENFFKDHKMKSPIFKFSYGQKKSISLDYFAKWSNTTTPFHYLAPHYLNLLIRLVRSNIGEINKVDIRNKNVMSKSFFSQPSVTSFLSFAAEIVFNESLTVSLIADCNWMEPEGLPFSSRQRVEILDDGLHYFSEQDDRGQMVVTDSGSQIPNPHFRVNIGDFSIDGYGFRLYESVLDYCYYGRLAHPQRHTTMSEYSIIAQILDEVRNVE